MNKEFIPYEQALELKKLGFNEPHFGLYGKSEGTLFTVTGDKFDEVDDIHSIKAPLYQQAFRWFRNQFGLYVWVKMEYGYDGFIPICMIRGIRQDDILEDDFNTYEEAELSCLKKLIEIVKNK